MHKKGFFLLEARRYLLLLWGTTFIVIIVSDDIFLNLLLLAVNFIVGYIFYIPKRTPFETSTSAIIAPVDGVVKSIEKFDKKTFIKIDKSLFGSNAIYSPVDGTIKSYNIKHGLFLDPLDPKSNHLNESGVIIYQCSDHIIKLYFKCGFYSLGLLNTLYKDRVATGDFQLYMIDGTITVELPEHIKIEVAIGDKLLGGYSLLSYIK